MNFSGGIYIKLRVPNSSPRLYHVTKPGSGPL